ncbi:MAG: hypothetical protein SFY66_14095 [Oculatellaceae cyanobacterium bins.114]|nr:hypothetical protein [Oculatellaceae cyanobacterium bins.114]
MSSQHALTSVANQAIAPQIIESRQQYHSCHILVPHSEQRLPAIAFNNAYYSFFKVEKDKNRAIELSTRLHRRGEVAIITKTARGYVIWIEEAAAKLSMPVQRTAKTTTPYKILTSPNQYQPCHIRVPDLNKPIAAICLDGKYYSLFKITDNTQQAVQLIKRLSSRGEETIITKTVKGYGIWIFEPEAVA